MTAASPSLGPAESMAPPEPDREAVRDTYDAVVGLTPPRHGGQKAFALVKFAYQVKGSTCVPAEAEPLAYDLRDEQLEPRLVPGSDFHLWKGSTDVVVQGSAFAPGGRPVPKLDVGVQIRDRWKPVRVHGDREVTWTGSGTVSFGPPRPFQEMPLTWDRAYGGVDWRVEVPEDDPRVMRYQTGSDHPGLYPRNPFGRGYVVRPEDPGEEVLLPNLEDPEDPLVEGRFVVGDPASWYRQPLPWALDWTHPFMWPRCIYFLPDVDAWYPGPEDDAMPEVRRGFLEPGYRRMMAEQYPGGMHPRFVQEATHGLSFGDLTGGEEVLLWRMHPDIEEMRFRLPWTRPPAVAFRMDGEFHVAEPHLHHVVLRPSESRVLMVWCALHPTPRTYVPGVHRHIPLALRVEGDELIHYETPETIRDEIDAAKKARAAEGTDPTSPSRAEDVSQEGQESS